MPPFFPHLLIAAATSVVIGSAPSGSTAPIRYIVEANGGNFAIVPRSAKRNPRDDISLGAANHLDGTLMKGPHDEAR